MSSRPPLLSDDLYSLKRFFLAATQTGTIYPQSDTHNTIVTIVTMLCWLQGF